MPTNPRRDDAWSGMGAGWSITSTLIAGMLVFGGLGYLVDRLAGTHKVFLGIGVVVGGIAGIYAVYVRYGGGDS